MCAFNWAYTACAITASWCGLLVSTIQLAVLEIALVGWR